MAKLSNKKLLIVAAVLSLVTTMLVYNYLKGVSHKTAVQETKVVVAKCDIAPKTKITADMVQEVSMPSEYVQSGAITSLNNVIGVIARERIVSGEQIIESRLAIEGKSVGFTGIIPRDKRAVTIAINDVTGVAGFVKPGDYVDVVVTFDANTVGDNVSNVLLQNVLVLAYNHETQMGAMENNTKDAAKEAVKTATVTLAVTPEEANKLTISEEKGKIRLALRPYMPLNDIAITQVTSPKDLVGVHASPVKSESPAPAAPAPVAPPAPPVVTERPYQKQKPSYDGIGIQIIRGTKTENI